MDLKKIKVSENLNYLVRNLYFKKNKNVIYTCQNSYKIISKQVK